MQHLVPMQSYLIFVFTTKCFIRVANCAILECFDLLNVLSQGKMTTDYLYYVHITPHMVIWMPDGGALRSVEIC